MTSSTAILPYLVNDYMNPLPFVDRTYGAPLFHTESEVAALAYSADMTLWSIEDAGILRQWAPDGRLLTRTFLSDFETIWAFSSDAALLAAGADVLVLWDAAQGKELWRVDIGPWVTAFAFSADGTLLASGHEDGLIHLWDVAHHREIASFQAHNRGVSALQFRPGSRELTSAGEDRLIKIWNIDTGECVQTLRGHTDRISGLAWQPHGSLLISAGWDTTLRVWSPPKPDPIILLNTHGDQVHTLSYNPAGTLLASADSDFSIHLWPDPVSGKAEKVLCGHTEEIKALAFTPDGTRLASAGADRVVHIWDTQSGELVAGPNPRARHGIALQQSIPPTSLFSTCGGSIQVWDLDSGNLLWRPPHDEAVLAIGISPDGNWLAAGGTGPEVGLYDVTSQSLKCTLQHTRGPVIAPTFSADGTLLATASITDGLLWLWRMGQSEAILVIPEAADGNTLEGIAFHPNGKWVAVGGIDFLNTGGADGALCIWDLEARDKLETFNVGVTSLAFDSTGKYLAAGTLTQSVVVWDFVERKQIFELPGHQDRIGAIAFSPDGSWLVSGSDDSTLRVWNVLTGRLAVARQFDAAIQSLAFSEDGKFLYTGNGNTTCYRLPVDRLIED